MSARHRRLVVIAFGLSLAAVVVAGCSHDNSPSMLDTNGPEARHIAGVWWLMFSLAAAVYAIVAALIFWALLRGRWRDPERRPSRLNENAFIVVGGVLVPVAILAVLAVVTVLTTRDVRNAEPGALQITVVGKRWWWDVRYPRSGVTTANEIHVPVGRQVDVALESDNVIHSFWVPELAGKVDMIPGQRNHLRFTAQRAGTFRGQCAEFCGIQHAKMVFLVVADPPATFDRWLTRRQAVPGTPDSDEAARGQVVFQREACAGCHTIKGTSARGRIGPDLSDVGSRRSLGSESIPNTPGDLAAWIANSQTIKPGNLMPPIPLSAGDLNALVAYLDGLR